MNSRTKNRLILASESPRRKSLLHSLGLSFEVKVSGIEETALPNESPAKTAERLSEAKAVAVASIVGNGIVLAADTVIDLEGELLGKPRDRTDAFHILEKISGRDHFVITGVSAVHSDSGKILKNSVGTRVRVGDISAHEITDYIASGEPMDKAGAYAIQGIGKKFIKSISGCYNNVVGFPLCEVLRFLRELDFDFPKERLSCRHLDGSECPRS